MSYNNFRCYGLNKIHDSLTENFDYKDNDVNQWKLVKCKEVLDSDGFSTDYCWYTNGEKHIFMFGDSDLYSPDEDYADWEAETEQEASEWFDSYTGFEEDDDYSFSMDFEEDLIDEPSGNRDFINDGFSKVYSEGLELED